MRIGRVQLMPVSYWNDARAVLRQLPSDPNEETPHLVCIGPSGDDAEKAHLLIASTEIAVASLLSGAFRTL